MSQSHLPWQVETGYRVAQELIEKYLYRIISASPRPHAIHYVAGPPGMMAGLNKMLTQTGIDDDDILSEKFVGY